MKNKKICKIIFCVSIMVLVSGLPGDIWVFESKTDEHEFGRIKIIQQIDASKNRSWPIITISIYDKDELMAKYKNIFFQKIFTSPDNKYFLGVSNRGVPGTAFVIFDSRGNLIREEKHGQFDLPHYCRESVTIVREWYDAKNPQTEFVYDKGRLEKILINGCGAERYDLLSRTVVDRGKHTSKPIKEPRRSEWSGGDLVFQTRTRNPYYSYSLRVPVEQGQ